jgi:probable phosphoglycerate mutase
MTDFPELYVLRHGETEWNRELRNQGSLDSPLTAEGQDHGRAQGRMIDALGLRDLPAFVSPQGRAVHTAELAGLDATQDARLAEINMGDAEGMLHHDMHMRWPDLGPTDAHPFGWYFRLPNSESFDDLVTRVTSFLQDMREPTLVVSHGITGRVLRGVYQGLDVTGMRGLSIEQGRIFHLKDGQETVL